MLLALAAAALAYPDRLAATYPVGTDVTDIVIDAEGLQVGWSDSGAGTLTILDTGTFDTTVLNACPGARGVAVHGGAAAGWSFLVGCADGTVATIDVSPEGLATRATETLSVGTGAVYALETDGMNLWAVVGEGDDLVLQAVTLGSGAKVEGFGQVLSNDTLEDTALTSDSILVVHGADEVSKVSKTAGTVITPQSSLGRSLVDAYPYPDANAVYLADEGGGLVRFESDNDYVPLTIDAATTTAVGIRASEGWMVLGAGNDALLYSFDGTTIGELDTISGAANLRELVTIDGYALGATEDGSVLVLTDRPWVDVSLVSPSEAVTGDTVTVTFSSDIGGDYSVYAGGTVDAPGTLLDTGTIDAGASATSEFVVDGSAFAEGANRIWVFVDDGGNVGRAAGGLSVDNPPEQVQLGPDGVGFGNGALTVAFDGLTAADIASYVIFVDSKPFEAEDFPRGGPLFSGDDLIEAPIVITAVPGESVSRTIAPLTNGSTYYVAVRAYDTGGLEGPMSEVQSETPEQTWCATCLAGDEGGFFPTTCGVVDGTRAGFIAVVLAGAALLRRRRVAVAAAGLLAVAVPLDALASTDDDQGPRTMNVQLRYGPTTVTEPYVQQIFGDDTEILWFEYGYASRFVDANLGIGFFQELGFLQTLDGRVSAEHDMLTMVPLALSVTGRLDLLDEQPIVPFGRIGVDYWMWRENWYVADKGATEFERSGGKYGWHYGGGLMLLLDVLDRRAGSRLEATTGINDTYLVAEYRKTNLVHGDDQVNLSSSEFSFGLKFDF